MYNLFMLYFMKNYAILLLALVIFGCCEQTPKSATQQVGREPAPKRQAWDNERHPLYGDVESIVTILHTRHVNAEGVTEYLIDTIQRVWFNEAGDMAHRYIFDQHERASYDEQGKLSTLSVFSLDEQLRAIRYYIYNDDGLMVEERGLDGDGVQTHKWLYEYNASGQMLLSSLISKDERNNAKNVFNYADGRLIEQQHYNAGVLSGSVLFKYDSAGNISSRSFFAGDRPMNRTCYSYDTAGNKVEELHELYTADEQSAPSQRNRYEYDAQGNRIRWEDYYYDEQGVEHLNLFYKHSYDSHNNVILTEHFRSSDTEQPHNRFEVHITYRK